MDRHHEPNREDRVPDEDADFAEEHETTTFADDTQGVPEDAAEPETPSGRGGDGGMDLP